MKIKSFLAFSLLLLSGCQYFSESSPTLTAAAPTVEFTAITSPTSTLFPTPEATLAAGEATPVPTLSFTASEPAVCNVARIVPEIPAELDELIPSVSDEDWTYGPDNAAITFTIYSDYQCPYCAKLSPVLEELQQKYPDEIRVAYRQFPLSSIHSNAVLASQAAEAAGIQGKYWKMHDLLFAKQADWANMTADEFKTWLSEQASAIRLDAVQFSADLTSSAVQNKVSESEKYALEVMQIASTPFIFVNKFVYQNRTDIDSLTDFVEYLLMTDDGFNECPEMTIDPEKNYTATLKTEKGDVVIELYPKQAPMAVNSFVFLARQKWYDNSTFFRVIPGYLVQSGDPSGSGFAHPGYHFTNEVTPELRFDRAGVVALANSGEGTNGSQFFITYAPLQEFDSRYTIFGQVIEGMSVLESLRPRNPDYDQILLPADPLISITIEEK